MAPTMSGPETGGCNHIDRRIAPAAVAAGLSRAERVCKRHGARLTEIRRAVLELLLASAAPIGAYAALEALQHKLDRQVAPPTVYRALDFLIAQGLAHRIERINAFVACAHPDDGHRAQFLICTCCGAVEEMHDGAVDKALAGAADRAGFAVDRGVVELEGLCPACSDTA